MTKGPRTYNGERIPLQEKVFGKLDSNMKKNETGPLLQNTQKSTQNGLKTWNVRLETIKLL